MKDKWVHGKAGSSHYYFILILHWSNPDCFLACDSEVLTKIMYLITQGEEFTPPEISKVFFSVTKLFYSKDVRPVLANFIHIALIAMSSRSAYVAWSISL